MLKCKNCDRPIMVETYLINGEVHCAPCFYREACIFCTPITYKRDCKGHDIKAERGNRFSNDKTFTKNMIFDAEK